MSVSELVGLEDSLEESVHLVVWNKEVDFEVVALVESGFKDAFPLPMELQAAAAEVGMLLDTTTAARLAIEEMPSDFWEGLEELDCGVKLRISLLGRSGRKYLEIFHAIRSGAGAEGIKALGLSEGELLCVARWVREKSLFDHQRGDAMMEIFAQLY